MKKFYESMNPGENLSWCKPLSYRGGEIIVALCEGRIAGVMDNGTDIDWDTLKRPDYLHELVQRVDPYYAEYRGYDDIHILAEAAEGELGCAECPWRDICDAMDVEEDEIEDYSGEIVKAWIAEDMAGSRCIIAKSSTDRWYNLSAQELGFFGEYAKCISDADKDLPGIAKEIAECIWAEVDEATWETASAHFSDENGKSEEEYLDGYEAVEIIRD